MSKSVRPRIARQAVHGVLLLDKPLGWSSNDALQKAKWLLRAEKAGHTGTLDPLATGLLPLCFGAATKFSQVSLDADKAYRATLRLGQRTPTGDAESAVIEERPVQVDAALIEAVLARFRGPISQLPPMHSALKKDGKALYEYARAGVVVERQPRQVTMHAVDLVDWQGDTLVIDVRCSKGTYIRTLAEDIGEALGCGAHLSALRRTASGAVGVAQSVTLADLEALDEARRRALLQPVDVLLADWPRVLLPADEAARFLQGLRRRINQPDQPVVRVYGPSAVPVPVVAGDADRPNLGPAFLGSAHITGGELIADRLLSPPEVQAMWPVAALPRPAAIIQTQAA